MSLAGPMNFNLGAARLFILALAALTCVTIRMFFSWQYRRVVWVLLSPGVSFGWCFEVHLMFSAPRATV